jgi:diguanylate cyclase (GGDEF)-like protein/PAS domain S-box-containing protein
LTDYIDSAGLSGDLAKMPAAGSAEIAFRTVIDAMPALIAYWDKELRCQFSNDAHQKWFGRSTAAMSGISMQELLGDAVFALNDPYISAVLDGQHQNFERSLTRADGSIGHTMTNYIPHHAKDGTVAGFFALITEITALKETELALRTSQMFLERTGTTAGVGGWEYDLRTGNVIWSAETARLHDLAPGFTPTLADAVTFYAPEARPKITALVRASIEEGAGWDVELPMISARGRAFWARSVGTAESEDGRVVRIVGAFQDVTSRRDVAQQLAESHELMRVTLNSIGDAVITTDLNGHIIWLNPVAERLTGWRKEAAHGRPLTEVFLIVHEESRQPANDPIATCLRTRQTVAMDAQTLLLSRDGSEYGIQDSAAPIADEQGNLLGAVLVFQDISEQRRLNREMTYRATHDPLTGLLNKFEFESRLRGLCDAMQSDPAVKPHALMYIDLDEFKLINDSCGHAAGDETLCQIGALLTNGVRARDTVARLGGDEFGVILENCTLAQAEIIARKICTTADRFRFSHEGKRFRVGTSIGLVALDGSWPDLAALLHAADTACYAAKEAGRNQVYVWAPAARTPARRDDTHWFHRLQLALDENQFEIFAQRIEQLSGNNRQLNCEILLRLREPDDSFVSPLIFFSAAERFHLATRIDRWVIQHVFTTLRHCPDIDLIDMVTINLSGQSVGARSFHRDVMEMIKTARFDVSKICFEITETAAITNLLEAKQFIAGVRACGVRIALDDFGAGASSFRYLKALDVDFLKIDGLFITRLLDDRLDQAAVRCFIEIARVAGIKSVAEHVESNAVLDEVRSMGVDMAQGYLIHRPEALTTLLGTLVGGTRDR